VVIKKEQIRMGYQTRRAFLASAAGIALTVAAPGKQTGARRMPNVLLITSDQQRKDSMGVYNAGFAHTPNLDKLAADGVVFTRAYTPHPTCTPARASILTGQYASRHGAYTIGTTTPENCLKLSSLLSTAGYHTCAVGKMHFQQVSTVGRFESPPRIYDEQFWRDFDGPYYGFQWTRLLNSHTSEEQAWAMRYWTWLKDHGLREADINKYFREQTGRWSLPRELHQSVFIADHAIEVIRKHQTDERPFFLWASFTDPHPPHVVPPPYDDMYDPNKVEYLGVRKSEFDNKPPVYRQLYESGVQGLPFNDDFGVPCADPARPEQEKKWRKFTAIHHGMVTLMDEEIGRILAALKDSGLYEDTLIIFTADHGDYLGNHGFFEKGFPAFEEVYNLPFVVKNPGQANAGKTSHALVGSLDIAPTVLDFAGLPIPVEIQGISQRAVFQGRATRSRESFLIENRAVQKGFYQKMLVSDRYKLVAYMGQSYGELYDMVSDPHQYQNLWDSPRHQERKQQMLAMICSAAGADTRKLAKAGVEDLLATMAEQMRSEEPVQERTSFS
jgi:uncharacterized sulfatase